MEDIRDINLLEERLWNLGSDENISVFEIETFLRAFLKGKPLPITNLAFQNYCRCSLNKKDEIFNSVGRCSYNPIPENISLQRCNYEGQAVFYASVPIEARVKYHGTAIVEVSLEQNLNTTEEYYFLTLSRWITKRQLRIFFFPDMEL